MKLILKTIMTGVCVMTLAASCQHTPVFISYHDVNTSMWDKRDTVRFDVHTFTHNQEQAPSAGTETTLTLGVRTTNSFELRALSLLVTQRDSLGATLARDTVHMTFADQQGRPSQQGFPFIETLQATRTPLRLQPKEHVTVEVTHLMRSTYVSGVHAIGIIVE